MTWPRGIDPSQLCQHKPKILVSSCLLGQAVRYDGKHKQQSSIDQYLSPWLEIDGHCPEVAAGLGIPRPPIQLVQIDESIEVRQVHSPHTDMTASLLSANNHWLANQQQIPVAAILKARSPSCGANSTPLHNPRGDIIASSSGLFVQLLAQHWPQLLIMDESQVATAEQCQQLILGCYLQQALNIRTPVDETLKQQLGWDDQSGLRGFIKVPQAAVSQAP